MTYERREKQDGRRENTEEIREKLGNVQQVWHKLEAASLIPCQAVHSASSLDAPLEGNGCPRCDAGSPMQRLPSRHHRQPPRTITRHKLPSRHQRHPPRHRRPLQRLPTRQRHLPASHKRHPPRRRQPLHRLPSWQRPPLSGLAPIVPAATTSLTT